MKDIFILDTEALDDLACKLSDEISNLEIYFTDHNGDFYSPKDKSKTHF